MAVKNKIFFPTLISSVDYQPVRTLPHIYFYNGLKDCDEYFIQHYQSGSTSVVEASIQNQFPYLDYYDGLTPSTGSNSLLFFNETPPYGVTPTGSLYTQYWDKYVSLLYNPRTRLINASAIIPLADYFEMELNDIVQWRGNYYHLRAINDYNLKDGTCKIQLLGPIISDAVTATQFDCTFNFSSSFEAIVPTTTSTTTVSPTTSTTTAVPTTSTTTIEPTTSTTTIEPTTSTTLAPTTSTTTLEPTTSTTLSPTTSTTLSPTTSTTLSPTTSTTQAPTTSTTTIAPTGEWPVSGNTFRMEIQVSGSENFATGSNSNLIVVRNTNLFTTSSFVIETDTTASSEPNNIINGTAFIVNNFSSSINLGTSIVVYRVKPSGSNLNLNNTWRLDGRSGPIPYSDSGPDGSFIDDNSIGIAYNNSNYFVSYDTQPLSKYTLNNATLNGYNWYQIPGVNNTTDLLPFTGSGGMDKYKFIAYQPTASLVPVATFDSWSLTLFTNDSMLPPQQNADIWNYNNPPAAAIFNIINIAAISVWDRVLTDYEIRNVHYYYSSSLGLDIGPNS